MVFHNYIFGRMWIKWKVSEELGSWIPQSLKHGSVASLLETTKNLGIEEKKISHSEYRLSQSYGIHTIFLVSHLLLTKKKIIAEQCSQV